MKEKKIKRGQINLGEMKNLSADLCRSFTSSSALLLCLAKLDNRKKRFLCLAKLTKENSCHPIQEKKWVIAVILKIQRRNTNMMSIVNIVNRIWNLTNCYWCLHHSCYFLLFQIGWMQIQIAINTLFEIQPIWTQSVG